MTENDNPADLWREDFLLALCHLMDRPIPADYDTGGPMECVIGGYIESELWTPMEAAFNESLPRETRRTIEQGPPGINVEDGR